MLVLVVATGLTAFIIFYNLRMEENQQFEILFHDHAVKAIDSFQVQFWHTIGTLDNFGVLFTSYARVSNSAWPFVTLPDFEFRGPSTKSLTETEIISFLPMVPQQTRAEWERYALGSSSWVQEGLEGLDQQDVQEPVENVFTEARNAGGRRKLNKEEITVDKQADPRPTTPPPTTPPPPSQYPATESGSKPTAAFPTPNNPAAHQLLNKMAQKASKNRDQLHQIRVL
jgi:hypothetical protein